MAMATSQANGKSKSHLTLWILAAILLAIAFSLWRPAAAENLHAGGEIFLTHTVIPAAGAARYALRFATGTISTKEKHVLRAWEIIQSLAPSGTIPG